MKTYLIVAGWFSKTGGMAQANHTLATYLANRGDEVHLVAHRIDEELRRNPNVFCHLVPRLAGSYLLSQPVLNRVGRSWAEFVSARDGRTIVNGGNCEWGDVNWVHYVHAAWRPLTGAGTLWKIKNDFGHRRSVREERRVVVRARLAIANSKRTKRDLEEKLGVDRHRIRTIYCGVDPAVFRPATSAERARLRHELQLDSRPCVVFVGALGDRRKGFDVLFEAWVKLCRQTEGWDAQLLVAGAGVELQAWKKRSGKLGLDACIRFFGFRDDIARILRGSDLLVSPVRYEAYGLNAHEALCCGIPALVSADAGVAERYPESLRDLLLETPEDVAALLEKLRYWRSNLEGWRPRVAPISKTLRGYTWNDMASEIVASIEEGGSVKAAEEIDRSKQRNEQAFTQVD